MGNIFDLIWLICRSTLSFGAEYLDLTCVDVETFEKHLLTFFILWKCLGNIVYLLSIGPLHVNLLKSWIIFWDVTIYLQQEPRKPLMMISDIVCVSWVCKKREATDYWAGLCHNFWFWGENYIFKKKYNWFWQWKKSGMFYVLVTPLTPKIRKPQI